MTIETSQDALGRLFSVECADATYRPEKHPLVFKEASGSVITGLDGKEYIDLCAGFGALPFGHNSSEFRAVCERYSRAGSSPIEHGMGDVYPSLAKINLLSTLVKSLPDRLCRGSLALTGAGAVEIAVKTALLKTKKIGFLVFDDGYHGLDLGILPLTARADFRAPFAGWISSSNVRRIPFLSDLDAIKRAIVDLKKSVGFAGAIVEPVQGRGGVKPAPAEWLKLLADAVHAEQGLLIFDEVFTGLGRTGTWSHAEEAECDLLCLGKALGGGMPVSACIGTEDAFAGWPVSAGEAIHTGTFFGHPFSAEVALATLTRLIDENWTEKTLSRGEKMLSQLREAFEKIPALRDVRGKGMMFGIELAEMGHAVQLMDQARERGVIVLPSGNAGKVISITPALNIPDELFRKAVDILVDLARRLS